MITCAIHQPNLVPWYPYFQKMMRCDVFVIMSNCQFECAGWQNRFKVRDALFTMPVHDSHARHLIEDMRYMNHAYQWDKIVKGVSRLGKAYRHRIDMLTPCVAESLADTNANIICEMARWLGIPCEVRGDWPTDALSTDRLVDICLEVNADVYLSGPSGKTYIDETKFSDYGIAVQYQTADEQKRVHTLEVLCE